jgi:DMSO/TMAO reductase YedYZ molybdopterin-dependent catalytic subunit
MEAALSRREKEQQMRAAGRLPPGQSLTEKFPVLHYGRVPSFDPATWDFRVWGELEDERHWSWQEFERLTKSSVTMDIHCVTRWSKFGTSWGGVSLKMLVEGGLVKPRSSARFVLQHCEGGFTVNLPLEVAMGENFLMATHLNGDPLTPDHGYPLRGVIGHIPGRDDLATPYFWKGGKWLRGLQFLENDRLGFWEQAGYHNQADVWKEQRVVGN